jgi:hypothetical protein
MINLNELNQDLSQELVNVGRAKEALHAAAEEVIAAKIALENLEADEIGQGLDGKNAEERKASLLKLTGCERLEVEAAEKKERAARLQLDTAQLALDLLRYRLRIAEIISKEQENK